MSQATNAKFTKSFNAIEKELPFNKEWSNGTGYFDFIAYGNHAPILKFGSMAKSVTPSGRRIIILSTRLGNVAIFDRYDGNEKAESPVFVANTTTAVTNGKWFSTSRVNEDDMYVLLGEFDNSENLGWRIEQLYCAMKKSEKQS